jgi:hypothetical protein
MKLTSKRMSTVTVMTLDAESMASIIRRSTAGRGLRRDVKNSVVALEGDLRAEGRVSESAWKRGERDLVSVLKNERKQSKREGKSSEAVALEAGPDSGVARSLLVEADLKKILVNASRNVERSTVAGVGLDTRSLLVSDSKNVERRSMVAGAAPEVDTRNHLDKNTAVVSVMKLGGARESVSRTSTERKLPRREKKSVRRNISRRDGRRVVVDGSLDSQRQDISDGDEMSWYHAFMRDENMHDWQFRLHYDQKKSV